MTESSPAGSTAFFTLALFAICAAVLLLLRYYLPLRTTPAYITVPVFLTIALPASIVLLVPIDLASSAGTKGIWLGTTVVYKSWRVTYWLTFVLSWAILPLLGEYTDSGYREPKARFLYSVRSNGRYWAIMLGTGVLGLIYFIWYNGFNLGNLKGMVMALAYAWSLALAIYLMGHGLVAFPRSLCRYASISGRLKRLQARAPKIHEKLEESIEKLDQYEWQVVQLKQRKNGTAREFQEWIDELAEKSNLPESRASVGGRTSTATVPPVITERYLADLTRKLKRARHAKVRFESEWDRLIHKAVKTQAILDSKASQRLDLKNSQSQTHGGGGFLDRFTLLTPYTRYLLHVHVIPTLFYVAWAVTSLASLAVVWSECIRSFVRDSKLSVIGLTVVHHPPSSRGQIGFGGQFIAAAWLCYMLTCSFFSLTEVKIWGNRALVRRNTYQESATWYALQLAKLTVPLSYNFVTFMPHKIVHDTSFYTLLGKYVESTPVGEKFSDYFPVFILVPVLATAFGLYKKVKNISGFGDLLEDEDEASEAGATGSWREGRALIERELQASSNNGSLGLSQRNALPSSSHQRYSDNPPLAANAEPSSRRPPIGRRRPPMDDDEGSTGNFFENFSTRVKNTFETRDWTFERPSWLGGEDEVERGQRSRGTGQEDRGGGFLGLFGGRPEEGRLRL